MGRKKLQKKKKKKKKSANDKAVFSFFSLNVRVVLGNHFQAFVVVFFDVLFIRVFGGDKFEAWLLLPANTDENQAEDETHIVPETRDNTHQSRDGQGVDFLELCDSGSGSLHQKQNIVTSTERSWVYHISRHSIKTIFNCSLFIQIHTFSTKQLYSSSTFRKKKFKKIINK